MLVKCWCTHTKMHTFRPPPWQTAQYQGLCPPRWQYPSWSRKTGFVCVFYFHSAVVFVCVYMLVSQLSFQQILLRVHSVKSAQSHSSSVRVSAEDEWRREREGKKVEGVVCVCKGLSFLPEFLAVGAWHCWAKITPLWRGGGVGESTNTVSRERAEQGCPGPSHLLQFWWTTAGWFWITTSHRYHLRLVVTQTSPPIGLMVSVSAWQQGDVKHSESFSHSAWFVLHPISVLFIPVTKMF